MRLSAPVSATMESVSSAELTYYRLAPSVQARLVGAAMVGIGVLISVSSRSRASGVRRS